MKLKSFFGLDTSHIEKDMKLLTTSHSDAELFTVCDILEGEKIPYLTQDRGGSLRVITGYSAYGTDISVREADYQKACEILEAYRSGEPVEEEDGEGFPEGEDGK